MLYRDKSPFPHQRRVVKEFVGMNYFEVKIDGRSLGYYKKDARGKFIRDRKLFHELEITEYNKSHLQVGLEQYIDGNLIYKYKDK